MGRFDQRLVLIVCLDFQFLWMVFLAISKATSVGFAGFAESSSEDKSTIFANDGERGTLCR